MTYIARIALCLFIASSVFSKTPWRKRLDIVQEDIKAIKSIRKTDLMIDTRMFELYSEKLNIVIERENTLILESLTSRRLDKELKVIKKIKSQILVNLERASRKVLGKTRDRNVIGRIHYFKALNYLSVKNQKGFYQSSVKAENYLKEGQTKYLLRVKLAEYYFNEKKFKKALSYYTWLAKKKETKWQTKYLYNISWCYFELNRFKTAKKYILMSYKKSKNKKYFKIGKQLVDSIMLFYANASETKEGVLFLSQNKIHTTENLLKLSHYTFEYGKQKEATLPLKFAMKKKINSRDFQKILSKKIIVNRHNKEFTYLNNLLQRVRKDKRLSVLKEEELYSNLSSYTGYLQELIKSHNSLKTGQKNKYLKFIINNFNFMSSLKRKKRKENDFLIAETLFLYKKYAWALNFYQKNINYCKKNKCSWKKDSERNFSGALKCLEKLEGNSKITKTKKNIFYQYVTMAPKNSKRKIIYKKILALEYNSKNMGETLSLLSQYSKRYPEDSKSTVEIYKNIVNRYIDKKDIVGLKKIRRSIVTGQLNVQKSEVSRLDSIIQQIHFKYAQRLLDKGQYEEARKLLMSILKNKKEARDLRKIAFRKVLEADFKNSKIQRIESILPYYTVFNFSSEEVNEAVFYLELLSLTSPAQRILKIMKQLKKKKAFLQNPNFLTISFKVQSQIDLRSTISLVRTNAEADYFISQYLVLPQKEKLNVQMSAAKNNFILTKLLPLLQRDFFLSLYQNENILNFIKRYKNSNSIYRKLVPLYNSANNVKKMRVASLPLIDSKKPFTEEYFGTYLNSLVSSFQKTSSSIEKEIKSIRAHLVPLYLQKATDSLSKDLILLSQTTYNSKDIELVKAAQNEIVKVIEAVKNKRDQFRSLHWESIHRLHDYTGTGLSYFSFFKHLIHDEGDLLWINSY